MVKVCRLGLPRYLELWVIVVAISTVSSEPTGGSTVGGHNTVPRPSYVTQRSSYSLSRSSFSTDASSYSTDASSYSTDASSYSTDASSYSTDASSYSTDASSLSTDESLHTTDDSLHTTDDGLSHTTDEHASAMDPSTTISDDSFLSTTELAQAELLATTTPITTSTTQTSTVPDGSTAKLNWYDTTVRPEYRWRKPKAWSSKRLYPFGDSANDVDILGESNKRKTYERCVKIKVNGRIGVPFFNRRYKSMYVCNNGILTFNQKYRDPMPCVLGTNPFYNGVPVIAVLWSQSDEATLRLLSDEWPQARTRVFSHAYSNSSSMSEETRNILSRAEKDVAESGEAVADFKPTWVLVVTWVNLPFNIGNCRDLSIKHLTGRRNVPVGVCKEIAKYMSVHANNFQALLITDGVHSFIKYNYPEGGVKWAYPGLTTTSLEKLYRILDNAYGLVGIAVAGVTSGDDRSGATTTSVNLNASNSLNMVNLDSERGNYRDGRIGEYLFRVETSPGVKTAEIECQQWVEGQNRQSYASFNKKTACPTCIDSILVDEDFVYKYRDPVGRLDCFETAFPKQNLLQRCCYRYKNSALVVGAPHGGHVTDVNPTSETYGYRKCCVESRGMCRQFYRVRPSNNGRNYDPPSSRPLYGDPHVVTSDGLSYTFNGLGEYLFTKIGNDVTIQARTERVVLDIGGLGQATFFSAICIDSAGLPRVQIQLNKNTNLKGLEHELQLIINGTIRDIAVIQQDANGTQSVDGVNAGIQFKRSNSSLSVLFSTGVSITTSVSSSMININLALSSSVKGSTVGLTGMYDGNKENDFTYPNKTVQIPSNSSEKDIFQWASTFAVSETDSLMYYTDNTDWYTYNNNSFVPVFTDDVDNWVWSSNDFKTKAYDTCGDDSACLYDVYITGSLEIGETSKKTAEDSVTVNSALNNFAPIVYGADAIRITYGQEYSYTVTVNDSNGDAVTVSTNINSSISISGSVATITATVTNMTDFSFTITAQDSAGAAGTKTPLAMLCSCSNNGTCVDLSADEQEDVETESVLLDCICPDGYTGSLCEKDLDACALVSSPCYPSVLCVDSPPPADHTGYTCGDCPAGYEGDGKTCSDVDECQQDKCNHICINSPGSFVCACRSGYVLNANGSTCDDVDECATSPCHQACNNTAGAYVCSCNSGFVLLSDKTNCEPANPCNLPSPCDDTNGYCNLVGSTQECSCKKGYLLNVNGSTCDELDECMLGIDACAHNCSNIVGGYNCSCMSGYTLGSNGFDCNDINECVSGTFDCHFSQVCTNKPGGYDCTCATGQVFKSGKCEAIVYTDPVENVTGTPVEAAKRNALLFSLKGMTLSQYTVEKEIKLFTHLASSANEICASSNCDFLPTSSTTRRKRAATTTFYKEYFARLPGYPKYDGNGDLQLAVYTLVPGSGVLSSAVLERIILDASANISSSIGVEIRSILRAYSPTSSTASTIAVTQPEQTTVIGEAANTGLYIALGLSLGLLAIGGVVVAIILIKMKNSKHAKTVPVSDAEMLEAGNQPVAGTNYTKTAESRPVTPIVVAPTTSVSRPTTPMQSAACINGSTTQLVVESAEDETSLVGIGNEVAASDDKVAAAANQVEPAGGEVMPAGDVASSEEKVATPAEGQTTEVKSRPASSVSKHSLSAVADGPASRASSGKQARDHSRVATPMALGPVDQ